MYFNEEAIRAKEERITQRKKLQKAILALSRSSMKEVSAGLAGLKVPHIPGLVSRLYRGVPLSPTQFYKIS